MKCLAAICVFFLMMSGSAFASGVKNQSHADATYLEMVRQARIMPKNFDFVALRKAYVDSSYYSPAGVKAYKIDLLKALDKMRAHNPEGQRELDVLLNRHFAHFAMHLHLREAASEANPIRVVGLDSGLHKWALNGILPSILLNQAGLIPEKSIHVIDPSEADFIADWHFKADIKGRSHLTKDGHLYDVVTMARNGHEARIHFNVDIPNGFKPGVQFVMQE